jgi:hypothetical protein
LSNKEANRTFAELSQPRLFYRCDVLQNKPHWVRKMFRCNHFHSGLLGKSGFFVLSLVFSFILSWNSSASAAIPYLTWSPVLSSQLAGYKVYYGTASQKYSSAVNVGKQTRHALSALPTGITYYLAVTAYNHAGYESNFSAERIWINEDADGDWVPDFLDAFPSDPAEWVDNDGDGTGDNRDNCPNTPSPDLADFDGDGIGDVCDNCFADPPIMVDNTLQSYFDSIQAVYDDPQRILSRDTILLQDQVYEENLVLDQGVDVILKGGYDCDYNEPISFSTIRSMTISRGTVAVGNIVIQ